MGRRSLSEDDEELLDEDDDDEDDDDDLFDADELGLDPEEDDSRY